MAKVKIQALDSSERERITQEFIQLIARLRNKEEMADVLLGLMTPSEVLMFARRVQVAKEIIKGSTQEGIRRKLKAGFDTIRSIEKWLFTGDSKGDTWLAGEIAKLSHVPKKAGKKIPRTGLDRYPEHRMMKYILQKFSS